MKRFILLFLMLISPFCRAQIIPVDFQKELAKEDRPRVVECLNRVYGNVTDADLNNTLDPTKSGKEFAYWGYFVKAKLLRDKPPVELFFHFKDGQCYACHDDGVTIFSEKGMLHDYLDLPYPSQVKLIEYDGKGTCALMVKADEDHAGGASALCEIYRLTARFKFKNVYKKIMMLNDKFGTEVHIDVTLTAADKSGYKDIFIKERYNPWAVPTYSVYYNDGDPVPEGYNKDVTVSLKNTGVEDMVDSIKSFFKRLFLKKSR